MGDHIHVLRYSSAMVVMQPIPIPPQSRAFFWLPGSVDLDANVCGWILVCWWMGFSLPTLSLPPLRI